MNDGEFSVWKFFADGTHEPVRRFVSAEQAVKAAKRCTDNAAAGNIQRVIITDGGDCICFEWQQDRGVTHVSSALADKEPAKRPVKRSERSVPCHVCGYLADSTALVDGGYTLSPGDLNVCFNCGALGILKEDCTLRAPRPEEAGNLPEPALMFQLAIRSRGLLEERLEKE